MNKITIFPPEFVQDGPRSFWRVRVGIAASQNARAPFAVLRSLKAEGFELFDDQAFSSPMKRHGGLRVNSVASAFVDKHDSEQGNGALGRVIRAFTLAGFSIELK